MFGDRITKRVLFATPIKAASVWAACAAELLRHSGHPKTVQHVAIDISAAYTKGVSDNFGNSRVVCDKFHVIQNAVEDCDQVRETEIWAGAGQRDRLKEMRWILLKNRVNWTEKEAQKWELVALKRCLTGAAYEIRLVLQGIYEWKDAGGVQEAVPKLVCLGVRDSGANQRTAGADGPLPGLSRVTWRVSWSIGIEG